MDQRSDDGSSNVRAEEHTCGKKTYGAEAAAALSFYGKVGPFPLPKVQKKISPPLTRGLCTRHLQARLRLWPLIIIWDQTLRRGVDFEGLLCMHCTRIRRASLTRLHSANCKGEVCRYVFRSSPASHCQRASGEGGNVRGTADAPMMWRHSRPPTDREAGNQRSLGTERMP